jgi:hypothetical protein
MPRCTGFLYVLLTGLPVANARAGRDMFSHLDFQRSTDPPACSRGGIGIGIILSGLPVERPLIPVPRHARHCRVGHHVITIDEISHVVGL